MILSERSIAPLTLSARLALADYGVLPWWQQPAALAARWRGWATHLNPAAPPCRRRTAHVARWSVSAALVFGLLGAPLGLAAGSNWAFRVNTATADDQRHPSVGSDALGNFVIAWQNNQGADRGIYMRRYNSNGAPIGEPIKANTSDATVGGAKVAMNEAGDFVIAWGGYSATSDGNDIYARRYAADGTPRGDEFRLSTYTTYNQLAPSIAIDATGDFVATWQNEASSDICAQRYAANGTLRGDEFHVNTYTTAEQYDPQVAMDAAGNFAITWSSENQDGQFTGVYAQRYAADGAPQGGEFRVNTTTAYHQQAPAIAMDATGDFAIAWSSVSHINAYPFYVYDVYLQRYSSAGVPQGGETLVNTTTISDQKNPALAMNAAGNFVVTWQAPEGTRSVWCFWAALCCKWHAARR